MTYDGFMNSHNYQCFNEIVANSISFDCALKTHRLNLNPNVVFTIKFTPSLLYKL